MNDFTELTLDQLHALPVGTVLGVRANPRHKLYTSTVVWQVTAPSVWTQISKNASLDTEEPPSMPFEELLAGVWSEDINLPLNSWVFKVYTSPVPHGKPEKLRIYMNRKLDITPNKRAAHAVHAALEAFGVHPGVKVIVLDGGPTKMEAMRISIHDAGHTELEPGTLTASTNWPEDSDA